MAAAPSSHSPASAVRHVKAGAAAGSGMGATGFVELTGSSEGRDSAGAVELPGPGPALAAGSSAAGAVGTAETVSPGSAG